MANIFKFLSKDGNITPEKARKSRQMHFRDKTAYVWGLRYQWDPSLSRHPVPRFPHFMPPWILAFIFQRVRSLKPICLCTCVNCVVQSLVQCRMSLAAHFSRSMWPTTRLTHKDASSPLPLGLMQFLGWVDSGWENLRKSFFELFFLLYVRSTWRLETKWIKRKCAMDILHLVTSIRIHHTQNELFKLDISCPGIFKLEDFWAERSERNDACCEEPFADITYVKRHKPFIQISTVTFTFS